MAQRDSEVTKRNILNAVGRVLERDGFRGLGINAVAKEAKVGKPLIYRYFGGMPQLLEEFGKDADFWLGLDDMLAEANRETGGVHPESFSENLRLVLIIYARILRSRPMLQEVLASELTAPTEMVQPLATARRDRAREALLDFMGDIEWPQDFDASATFAILLAGVQYLTLRGRVSEHYWGVPLKTDEDWARFEQAIGRIADLAFASTQEA
jgi:AcrR family transcriptional regulator